MPSLKYTVCQATLALSPPSELRTSKSKRPQAPRAKDWGAKSTGLTSLAPPFLSPPHTKQLRYLSLTEEVLGAVVVIIIVLWEVVDPEAVPSIDAWRKQGERWAVNVLWLQTTIH